MRLISATIIGAGLAIASPFEVRDSGPGSNPLASQLTSITSDLTNGLLSVPAAASALGDLLLQAKPTTSPKSIPEWQASQKAIFGTQSGQNKNIANASIEMLAAGAGGFDGLQNYFPFLTGLCPGINCDKNYNPAPRCFIYPKKSLVDAPYSIPESKLREAIYIPKGFTYGSTGKQPVLLVPGTGSFGGVNFQNNFAKIIAATDYAEAFWLNIPGAQLGDVQLAAEYVAYAINYMQCQSSRKIATLAWSQGSVDSQWALKYWPSTRSAVTDLIAISGDYHGTVAANLLCAALPCDPAVLQQEYSSKFIQTLRKDGGDSAYVPTTNIYSGLFDEIVEPQQDPYASGSLNDARKVGVTNAQVQLVCPGEAAGTLYGHEGVLYNPIAAALALDALQNDGPGQLSRIDRAKVCADYIAPPLTIEDALFTEGVIPLAGYYLITYMPKSTTEPPIKAYAA